MNEWISEPVTETVGALTPVPQAERDRLAEGPEDKVIFAAAFDAIPALRQVETGGRASGTPRVRLRVAAWNVERLRYLDDIGDTLAGIDADVVLLSEIDKGMARSGNGHRIDELAARLGGAYAYGVEFLELGLGGPAERAAHDGGANHAGFHGNGIVSRLPLLRPFMVRLEAEGGWFERDREEPRVGGRMAIGGQVELAGRPVTLVSVHLENRSDAPTRARHMAHLMTMIDRYDAEAPVVIGGDLNSSTFDWAEAHADPETVAAALAADPWRQLRVADHEPLFGEAVARGYDYEAANVPEAPTQRFDEPRRFGPAKIDWFFTRGLRAFAPRVVPAVRVDGTPSSDHECLVVEVELE